MPVRSSPCLSSILLVPAISTLILQALPCSAYIPAMPVNDTSALNLTDSSTISIAWQAPSGVYSGAVSYQLKADIPTGGVSSGALVHFTEASMGKNLSTDTPWIAYISCDRNESEASQYWDIFTLARDRGAVSALLYTATSQSCLLNREYIDDFEKPLDVFATKTVQVARVIDNQWTHTNDTFYTYNGTLLNMSGTDVNQSIAGQTLNQKTYLVGTLVARNSTGQVQPTDIPSSSDPNASSGSSGPSGSMIALYTIVSVVGSLFILMLVLGWARARRYPERYGRQQEGGGEAGGTTARGLAQAILDTFPVTKFRNEREGNGGGNRFDGVSPKRLESEQNLGSLVSSGGAQSPHTRSPSLKGAHQHRSIVMRSMTADDAASSRSAFDSYGDKESGLSRGTSRMSSYGPVLPNMTYAHVPHSPASASWQPSDTATDAGRAAQSTGGTEPAAPQASQGDEAGQHCPICLLDFEDGDDLRVLPCEREHAFHQACIDPWLLEVSGSCPLCRKDFNNPNPAPTVSSSDLPSSGNSSPPASASVSTPPTQSGFPRYLAFMRRERGSQRGRNRANTATSGRTQDSHTGGRGGGDVFSDQRGDDSAVVVSAVLGSIVTTSSTGVSGSSGGGGGGISGGLGRLSRDRERDTHRWDKERYHHGEAEQGGPGGY